MIYRKCLVSYLFFEDLFIVMRDNVVDFIGVWRVYYYVLIFFEWFGYLGMMRIEIEWCLEVIGSYLDVKYFEVEIYVWNVFLVVFWECLLVEGIVDEMIWFCNLVEKYLFNCWGLWFIVFLWVVFVIVEFKFV